MLRYSQKVDQIIVAFIKILKSEIKHFYHEFKISTAGLFFSLFFFFLTCQISVLKGKAVKLLTVSHLLKKFLMILTLHNCFSGQLSANILSCTHSYIYTAGQISWSKFQTTMASFSYANWIHIGLQQLGLVMIGKGGIADILQVSTAVLLKSHKKTRA